MTTITKFRRNHCKRLKVISFLLFAAVPFGVSYLEQIILTPITRRRKHNSSLKSTSSPSPSSPLPSPEVNTADEQNNAEGPKKSFWKPKGAKTWWVERKNLDDLEVGEELYGHVVDELLTGKTGPKLYFDCGVGRTDKKGSWHIVNGMMRLDRSKVSVARKRAARYRSKDRVPLYVSRIQKECARFEVCASPEEADTYSQQKPKIPVASLEPGQEVEGTICKLYPYGAIVDVGANRRGLLHIKKVAALYQHYIDKEKGLFEAGVERGARVRLMVESVTDKRLFLDFTPDVREAAQEVFNKSKKSSPLTWQETSNDDDDDGFLREDLQDWQEYANQQTSLETTAQNIDVDDHDISYDEDAEDDDEYDEDSDIEEALGLDTY
jgi:predicted RNA-binding protein with RPS1 domain